MKSLATAGLVIGLILTPVALSANDSNKMPEMPPPTKEHVWLEQFVGEWESQFEISMDPSQPPTKGKGTEIARSLGGFWVVGEGTGEMEGMPGPMKSILTLGYDPQKQKYVGTWVDSMTSHLWHYEGTLDSSGKKLTLETEGPCPTRPGTTKFKEIVEFKDRNHRLFTSSILGDDGKWTTMVKGEYRRKQ